MDETDYSGLLDYLMNTTALSSQGVPTAQPTTTRPAVSGGLSGSNPYVTADQYGLPNALLWAGIDPETGLKIDATDRDINEMKALGLGAGTAGSTEVYVPGVGLQRVSNKELPTDAIMASWTPGTPIYEASRGFFSPEAGAIRQGNAIAYHPGYQYQLIDELTGKVLGTANDEATFEQLAALSSQAAMPARENQLVNLKLYRAAPGSETPQWEQIKSFEYDPVHGFQTFLSAALPMALGALAPAVGPLSGVLGSSGAAAAGTALGSAASGAIAGKPIGDILKNALIAGGGAYLGGELLGGAQNGGSASSPGTSGSAASGAGSALGDIVVMGAPGALGGAAAGGALSSALVGGAPNLGNPQPNDIVVTAPTGSAGGTLGGTVGSTVGGALPNVVNGVDRITGEIVAQAPAQNQPNAGATTGGVLPNVINGVDQATGDIVVKAPTQNQPNAGATTGGALSNILDTPPPSTLSPSDIAKEVAKDTTTGQTDGGVSLSKLIDYLQAAGLGVGLIGDLLGGGSKPNTANRIPAGFGAGGGGSGVFGSELPAANLPGGTSTGARTAADLATRGLGSNLDYYRYGYGPEQSFMQNVPQGARNTSTAYTGYEQPFEGIEKLAEGGMPAQKRKSFAVSGPGDGRDDKIDALLSDGEYVMDAETVALLGNGSSKAGAEALDQFRVNVRKHKGQKLAAGRFSAKAKRPEQYLKKGRA